MNTRGREEGRGEENLTGGFKLGTAGFLANELLYPLDTILADLLVQL